MRATSAGIARTPYLVRAYAQACDCAKAVNELCRKRTMDKAIQDAQGYWNVYLGFFGHQSVIFHFDIVDLRDGAIVWRDGRQLRTEEEQDGRQQATERAAHQDDRGSAWPF